MMKIIEMVKCNRVAIIMELALQFGLGAACTLVMIGFWGVIGIEPHGSMIEIYSKMTLGSSLTVFFIRLHNRLDKDPAVIESREDRRRLMRAIAHDAAEMLSVWFLIGLYWAFHWALANYLLSGFITA